MLERRASPGLDGRTPKTRVSVPPPWRRAAALSACLLSVAAGVAGLAAATGSGLTQPALTNGLQQLSDAWQSSAQSEAAQTAYRPGDLRLAQLPASGDEHFWLSRRDAVPVANILTGAVSLGDRITIGGNSGPAQTYEVVELRPVGERTQPASVTAGPALPEAGGHVSEPHNLTIVVAKEIGTTNEGAAPRTLRFVIETLPTAGADVAPRLHKAL